MRRFFLLGPTASGKSAVAVPLARLLGAEILTLDSMQVYRGMDVGTAKPGPEERGGVAHHLLDLADPREEYSVARWLEAADAVEADLRARGIHALYAGGTGMYLKARVSGLVETPPPPEDLRRRLRERLEAGEREALRAELERLDPALHARLHPGDDQRLLRGLEVVLSTGRPLSSWQEEWEPGEPLGEPAVALAWEREVLRRRVEERFDRMLEEGLVEEVQALRAAGGPGPTARKALGYRQILDWLEGRISREEARRRAIQGTRTLIRRQMTWLRSFPDLRWLPVGESDDPEDLARKARDLLREARG